MPPSLCLRRVLNLMQCWGATSRRVLPWWHATEALMLGLLGRTPAARQVRPASAHLTSCAGSPSTARP